MADLRGYDPTYFQINGNVLTLTSAASNGWVSFNRTFATAGAAHDYKLDTAWSPSTLYPDTDVQAFTGGMSGVLGDGSDVPYFYACGKTAFNNCTLTGDGFLRFEHTKTSENSPSYPDTSTGNRLVILLPAAEQFTLDFTLRSNLSTAFNSATQGVICSLVRHLNTGAADVLARVHWDSSVTICPNEKLQAWPTSSTDFFPSPANLNPWTNATSGAGTNSARGVTARRYRIAVDKLGITLSGQPFGGGSWSVLHGRQDAMRGLKSGELALAIHHIGGDNTEFAFPYLDIGNIVHSGTRALY